MGKVLVACEYSGIVREAFRAHGHDAMSCDLLETEIDGPHYQGDVRDIISDGYDLMIAHPPCTYLCLSGARYWKDRQNEQKEAIQFVEYLLSAPIPRIAVENPVGVLSRVIRKPDCIIHPYHFGHAESKATCLWLKNLPPLMMEHIIIGDIEQRIHMLPPSKERWKERSRTYKNIADAMSRQWGVLL